MPVFSEESQPGAAPATPSFKVAPAGVPGAVARALRLIEDGLLDHAGIDALCERLGIGARQLRRLFNKHLGTTPVHVARIRRARFARRLIETTGMSMANVARAAGFGSVRRFNAVMNEVYGCAPTRLRKTPGAIADGLELEIPVEGSFPWTRLLEFLEPWTASGVEKIVDGRYHRTAVFGQAAGEVCVSYEPARNALRVRVSSSLGGHLLDVVSGVRRLFDIDAPIDEIKAHLSTDPVLRKCLDATPGLRMPGAFEHFETAVLMLLHQHMRPDEASALMDRIIAKYGKPIPASLPSLTHLFPTPYALSTARLEAVGVSKRRSRSIQALAKAVHEGALRLDGAPSLDTATEGLRSIADLGATTAKYIAMRVYREPDAFPPNSPWLRKALSHTDAPVSAQELESRAERWSPWRAYAAMYLWDSLMEDESVDGPAWRSGRESIPPSGQVA